MLGVGTMNRKALAKAKLLQQRLSDYLDLHRGRRGEVDRRSGYYRGWGRGVLGRTALKLTASQIYSAAEGLGLDPVALLIAEPSPFELLRAARETAHGKRKNTVAKTSKTKTKTPKSKTIRARAGKQTKAPKDKGKKVAVLKSPPTPILDLEVSARRVLRHYQAEAERPLLPAPSAQEAHSCLLYGSLSHRRQVLRQEPRWRSLTAVKHAALAIDKLRYAKPEHAVTLARILTVEVASKIKGLAGVEAFCRAGGVLGSSHRIGGSMEAAAFCLESALRISQWAPSLVRANLLQRAGTALYSFARYRDALKLMDQAAHIYGDQVHSAGIGQTWTQRAILYFSLEQRSKATECAQFALTALPDSEKQYRATAYHVLATLHRDARELATAERNLRLAEALVPGDATHSRGMILWTAAMIAKDRKNLDEAEYRLRQAMKLLEQINPFDLGLATVDLAEVLLAAGKAREVTSLADGMASLLEPFQGNDIAAAAAKNLSVLARAGTLCQEAIDEARRVLAGERRLGIRPPAWH